MKKSDYNKFQRQFLSSENVNTKNNFSSGLSLSVIDFILTGRFPLSGKRYEEVRDQLDLLLIVSFADYGTACRCVWLICNGVRNKIFSSSKCGDIPHQIILDDNCICSSCNVDGGNNL